MSQVCKSGITVSWIVVCLIIVCLIVVWLHCEAPFRALPIWGGTMELALAPFAPTERSLCVTL